MKNFIKPFNRISAADVSLVGGKNASLGEMIGNLSSLGIEVPDGFAITVEAYSEFLTHNDLYPVLKNALDGLDRKTLSNLSDVGEKCRTFILDAKLPPQVEESIKNAHAKLMSHGLIHSVAVRSSATAEDSPTASFAGQHESYLNVAGADNAQASEAADFDTAVDITRIFKTDNPGENIHIPALESMLGLSKAGKVK